MFLEVLDLHNDDLISSSFPMVGINVGMSFRWNSQAIPRPLPRANLIALSTLISYNVLLVLSLSSVRAGNNQPVQSTFQP